MRIKKKAFLFEKQQEENTCKAITTVVSILYWAGLAAITMRNKWHSHGVAGHAQYASRSRGGTAAERASPLSSEV